MRKANKKFKNTANGLYINNHPLYAIKQNHKTTEFQIRNPVVFITVLLRLLTINQEKDIINLWILSIILQK